MKRTFLFPAQGGASSPLWRGGAKHRGGLHKNELSDHLPGSAGTPPTEENCFYSPPGAGNLQTNTPHQNKKYAQWHIGFVPLR